MTGKTNQFRNRALLIAIIVILLVYLWPFFKQLITERSSTQFLFEKEDNVITPVLKSSLFAAVSSLLVVSLSLWVSLLLSKINLKSKGAFLLSLLIIPIVLGNVSTAFIWKLILQNHIWFFSNYFIKFATLIVIQYWQYGSLLIYIFWLNQKVIAQKRVEYATVVKMSPFEGTRDIILPVQRSLLILLLIVTYLFSYYEDANISLIFKGSRGTHTELINQWLNRSYQSESLINPNHAFTLISQNAVIAIVSGLVGLIATISISLGIYGCIQRSKRSFDGKFQVTEPQSNFTLFFILAFVLIPILLPLLCLSPDIRFGDTDLSVTLIMTFLASCVSTSIAIMFAIISRYTFQKTLSDLNYKSAIFLISIFLLLLTPPIIIMISGFKWMQVIGYASTGYVKAAWVIAHAIVSFPLLASFLIATHFRLSSSFIDYSRINRLTSKERIRDLFWGNFKLDYLLVFILSFSMIWNESTINRVLSDSIPSFAADLTKSVSGKGTNYGKAVPFLYISICLSLSCVCLWNYIIVNQKSKDKLV